MARINPLPSAVVQRGRECYALALFPGWVIHILVFLKSKNWLILLWEHFQWNGVACKMENSISLKWKQRDSSKVRIVYKKERYKKTRTLVLTDGSSGAGKGWMFIWELKGTYLYKSQVLWTKQTSGIMFFIVNHCLKLAVKAKWKWWKM